MVESDRNELVLAQNQHAFIQDETKGMVQVAVGPFKLGLTASDKLVNYDKSSKKFFPAASIEKAVNQNPTVPEDSYVVLENPASSGEKTFPPVGSHSPVGLEQGKKVNIPGPIKFALWPEQVATVIEGHKLKTNEYLVARIFNVEEALANWPIDALGPVPITGGDDSTPSTDLVVGKLFIVKGTDVSFFIPPTGIEVVKEPTTKEFVRQAVTLEQLEYSILLDENGNKRYEKGPQVVFPEATEKFVSKAKNSAVGQGETTDKTTGVKFKAIELTDNTGIYVKVIADYKEGKNEFKVGDELFITGRDQRFYFPRNEHALIEYNDESGNFKRQKYYGIAIPKGEARYVLNKNTGKIRTVQGEAMLLPDPRFEIVVKRVLDRKTVNLWYPGNKEALEYNAQLSEIADGTDFISMNAVTATSLVGTVESTRSINRGTSSNVSQRFVGDTLRRNKHQAAPPTITIGSKYEGPPRVDVWTGFAVQVVDKSGKRKVVKGPSTVHLEYDENLEKMELSTGKPKNTDNTLQTVYLQVDHNKVSDVVTVETKDMVTVDLKLSYRVNFEGDSSKWFSVANYVKFLCDHLRSVLRGAVKKLAIKDFIDNSNDFLRDTILGVKDAETGRPGLVFRENNMRIYDVEVLGFNINDGSIAEMIQRSQKQSVSSTLNITAKRQELENNKEVAKIELELANLRNQLALNKIELENQENKAINESLLAKAKEDFSVRELERKSQIELEKLKSEQVQEELNRRMESDSHTLDIERQKTEMFVKKMGSVDQKLASAIQDLADNNRISELSKAVAPLAIHEQQGISTVLKRIFQDMNIEKLNSLMDVESLDR